MLTHTSTKPPVIADKQFSDVIDNSINSSLRWDVFQGRCLQLEDKYFFVIILNSLENSKVTKQKKCLLQISRSMCLLCFLESTRTQKHMEIKCHKIGKKSFT